MNWLWASQAKRDGKTVPLASLGPYVLALAMWRMVEPQFFSSKHPDDLQVSHHFQDTHISWCFFPAPVLSSRFRVVGQTSDPNGVFFSTGKIRFSWEHQKPGSQKQGTLELMMELPLPSPWVWWDRFPCSRFEGILVFVDTESRLASWRSINWNFLSIRASVRHGDRKTGEELLKNATEMSYVAIKQETW